LKISRKLLELGFSLVGTEETSGLLMHWNLNVNQVKNVAQKRPNILDLIKNGEIAMVISIANGKQSRADDRKIRRAALEKNIPLITTASGAFLMLRGIESIRMCPMNFQPLN
jgi:carbamoyl-phosphate synthase large subunit